MGYKQRMGSDGTIKRMRAVFAGRVQGVGFRYMVCHAAEPFAVTGFVRNLWNGDVEVIAEGPLQELSGLLDAIKGSRLGRNITDLRMEWRQATDEFDHFGILF